MTLCLASRPTHPAVVHQSAAGLLAIREDNWKLILDPAGAQLHDLAADPGETANLATRHPEIVRRLGDLLQDYSDRGRSTPGPRQRNDVTVDLWQPPPARPAK